MASGSSATNGNAASTIGGTNGTSKSHFPIDDEEDGRKDVGVACEDLCKAVGALCRSLCTPKSKIKKRGILTEEEWRQREREKADREADLKLALQTVASGEPTLNRRTPPVDSNEDVQDTYGVPVFLRVECKAKKALEDFYELQSFTKNGRPVWSDGQNYIYCTTNKQWAIAMDEEGVNGDRGWLYDDLGGAEAKYPDAVRMWKLYDGQNWNRTIARVHVSPPPHINVECSEKDEVSGNYRLLNPEDETPMWGNGRRRLYLNETSCHWAVCLMPVTAEQGGGVVRSGADEPVTEWPNMIREWDYHSGTSWEKSTTRVTATKRPPPKHLEVKCPEKPDINGTYTLQKERINKFNAWCDGDNLIYQTKNRAWAVCIGRASAENDQGWMYAKLRESKFPDKVEEWHVYDGQIWSHSRGSSVTVPEKDKVNPPAMPVYKPEMQREARTGIIMETSEPANIHVTDGEGATAAPTRMTETTESDFRIQPNTAWHEIVPTRSCLSDLRENPGIRTAVSRIDAITVDVQAKADELKFANLPVKLKDNYLVAIVAYTHDIQANNRNPEGNIYYELNKALRERGVDQRVRTMETWGNYLHYLIMGLEKLPDFTGTCYRGYPDRETVLSEYQLGRPIQWGAFASVTTSWEAAKSFINPETGVIFKIAVTSGRQIADYSFFPSEDEVLLTPAHRFTVASEPYEVDGYTVLYLIQQRKAAFVS